MIPESQPWYVEVPPPPALANLVASLWEMRVPAHGETRVRIMPNACVDIVLYCAQTSRGEGSASIVTPPHRSFVVGSTLRSFLMRSAGWNHVLGASILPAGVEPILGLPARVIGQTIALLDDVLGARAKELEDRVLSGPTNRALGRLTEELIRLRKSCEANAAITRAVNAVRGAGGVTRVDEIANTANMTARHLERNFLEHVGISPKLFARLVRFDRVVRDISARGGQTWSQFALAHGYSDQAHFINDFKEFAGVTPTQFELESREQLNVSDFSNTSRP